MLWQMNIIGEEMLKIYHKIMYINMERVLWSMNLIKQETTTSQRTNYVFSSVVPELLFVLHLTDNLELNSHHKVM